MAFLGVDLRDNRGAANKLLREIPLTYPSYEDPDGKVSNGYKLLGHAEHDLLRRRGQADLHPPGPVPGPRAVRRGHQALRDVVTEVRPARDQSEVDAALALRYEVFCVEQGVSLEEELDGRDDEALHLVVVDDGEVVGTCRLLAERPEVKLGRMAVAHLAPRPRAGGRAAGRGRRPRARAAARERIALAAQLTARALYERAGYAPYGDVFLDAGIEHVMMGKALE